MGKGVEKDEAKAAALYEQAAFAGDGPAQNNLGQLYRDGRGVAQDLQQAAYCRLLMAIRRESRITYMPWSMAKECGRIRNRPPIGRVCSMI